MPCCLTSSSLLRSSVWRCFSHSEDVDESFLVEPWPYRRLWASAFCRARLRFLSLALRGHKRHKAQSHKGAFEKVISEYDVFFGSSFLSLTISFPQSCSVIRRELSAVNRWVLIRFFPLTISNNSNPKSIFICLFKFNFVFIISVFFSSWFKFHSKQITDGQTEICFMNTLTVWLCLDGRRIWSKFDCFSSLTLRADCSYCFKEVPKWDLVLFGLDHVNDPSNRLLQQRRRSRVIVQLNCSVTSYCSDRQRYMLIHEALELGLNRATISSCTDEPIRVLLCLGTAGFYCFCLLHDVKNLQWCFLVAWQRVKTHQCVRSCSHWEAIVQKYFETTSQRWFCKNQDFMWFQIVKPPKQPSHFNQDGLETRFGSKSEQG